MSSMVWFVLHDAGLLSDVLVAWKNPEFWELPFCPAQGSADLRRATLYGMISPSYRVWKTFSVMKKSSIERFFPLWKTTKW